MRSTLRTKRKEKKNQPRRRATRLIPFTVKLHFDKRHTCPEREHKETAQKQILIQKLWWWQNSEQFFFNYYYYSLVVCYFCLAVEGLISRSAPIMIIIKSVLQ